tara:strand:+ start:1954 stop:3237 length:1284 start_codon:yes stop_codon:yes gene_type:complete
MKQENNHSNYIFLAFLILLNVMNFVDRQLLASFANFIIPDLGLTNTQFGILTGFGFLFFYSIMGLFMGFLADKFDRPKLIAFGVALWSLLTSVSGLAKNFIGLLIPRMFIGVGESILTPTSLSILGDRFPKEKMGFVSGAYYLGIPIGAGLSLIIAGYLGPVIGWRMCFYILGGFGLILAVIMFFVKDTPRKANTENDNAQKAELKTVAKELFTALKKSPALTLCIYGGVVFHFVLGAAVYDQVWYVQERGFERAEIAQYTGYIIVVFGIIGNLIGGIGSDWFTNKYKLGRPMFLFWFMIFLLPINIAGRLVMPDNIIFWISLMMGAMQLGAMYGPTFSTVQELAPSHLRATVIAFFILNLNMIGMFLGTTGAGIIIDLLIASNIEFPYTKTLLSFTILSGFSIPLFWFAGVQYKKEMQVSTTLEEG